MSALPDASTPPKTVILKDVLTGGATPGLQAASFADSASAAVPATSPTPLSGTYLPASPLASLAGGNSTLAGLGGSQGSWVLRVIDLGANHAR